MTLDSEATQTEDFVDGEPISALDRSIALPINVTTVVATIAVAASAFLRLPDLARWAVSPEEGAIALAAHDLVRGRSVPDDMLGQPFVVEWIALFMFFGDTVETVGRVALAVAGIAAVVGLFGLMPRFNGRQVAAASLLLALSPTMIAASRTMDGGMLLGTLSMLLFAVLLRLSSEQSGIAAPLTGVLSAALLLSGSLGLPALVVVLVGAFLTGGIAAGLERRQIVAIAAGFVATFILVSSALLTQPSSLYEAPARAAELFWNDHLSVVGTGAHLGAWNILLNEPLILLLAIAGFVWRRDSELVRGLATWSVAALALVSLLGNAGAGGFALTLIPLGLLAGFGTVELVQRLSTAKDFRNWSTTFVVAAMVIVIAFISIAGLASPTADRSTSESVVRFLLITIVVLAPAGYLLVRAAERLPGLRVPLLLATAGLLIGGITVRSAVLSATEWPGEPANLHSNRAMSEEIPIIIERVQRVSRDLTRTERDARMPVGGIGLRIALDERIEQPFAWYFRAYPNLTVFDPSLEELPEGTQIALLAGNRDPAEIAPGLPGATYPFRYDEAGYVSDPDWADLAGDLFQIDGWRNFASFVLNRESSEPISTSEFHLQAISIIAERFAVSTGPYALDDRAGIGTAGGQFNQPRGIAFDGTGGLYVVDGGNSRIQHFDATGGFDALVADGALSPFPGGTGGAGGIAVDSEGNLYVADTWNHQIRVYNAAGEQVRSWGVFYDAQDDPDAAAERPGEFYGPRDIALHDGLLYVTDTGNERVQVFQTDGEFVRMFGHFGTGQGQLTEPVGIAVTNDGIVLVADSHNARIARFTADGEPLDPWPVELWTGQQFFEPYVSIGPDGRVYASNSVGGQIAIFSQDGAVDSILTDPAMLRPYDMAASPDGLQLLVTDGLANAVLRVPVPPGS